MDVTLEVFAAIDRLNHNSDFRKVTAVIESAYDEAVEDLLAQSNSSLIFQRQGYAQAMNDVLQIIRSARAVLESQPGTESGNT